LPSRQ
jgi:hypothetical protein